MRGQPGRRAPSRKQRRSDPLAAVLAQRHWRRRREGAAGGRILPTAQQAAPQHPLLSSQHLSVSRVGQGQTCRVTWGSCAFVSPTTVRLGGVPGPFQA